MLSPVELRHNIHKNPELALKEKRTTKILQKNIKKLARKYDIDIDIKKPLETGLLIDYNNGKENYILLRADIDALPVEEKTGGSFSSNNSNMHACGHDVHSAILYGTIEKVFQENPRQNILFLFQPAEEEHGGAKKILNSGILDDYNIKRAHSIHVTDEYLSGKIATGPDVLFSASIEIDIKFKGKSSHIAFPQKGKNALNALRSFIDIVEKYPQNYNSPIIFGIGKVEAGSARNVIPESAKLQGTLRTERMSIAEKFINNIDNILNGIESSFGIETELELGAKYREVTNSNELYKDFSQIIPETEFINCDMKMTAEDFGYFSAKYPSLMVWLGTRQNGQKEYGLHNSKFLPDDSIIEKGIEVNEIFLEL